MTIDRRETGRSGSDRNLADGGVTVVMPTYNQAGIIAHSIRSVLNQTYSNFELIVVDDESPDDTAAVVAVFDDPRIHYVRQRNTGLPGARNTALRRAAGEYVVLLDGDDLLAPQFLARMVAVLKEKPATDAVYCRAQFVDEEGRRLPQLTGRPVPAAQLYDQLLWTNFMTPNCMLAARRCYEAVGYFDTTIPRGEGDMWLQFARRFHVIGIDDVLAYYRVVVNSMSSSDPLPMLAAAQAIVRKHAAAGAVPPARWPDRYRRAFARCHITAAVEYLQQSREEPAYGQLRDALALAPELLAAADVLYELAVGRQPRGYRGDFHSLDVEAGGKTLIRLLRRLFVDPDRPVGIDAYRRGSLADAYLVLARLAHGQDNGPATRSYLFAALRSELRRALRQGSVGLLLRSFVGRRRLRRLRGVPPTPSTAEGDCIHS